MNYTDVTVKFTFAFGVEPILNPMFFPEWVILEKLKVVLKTT